MNCYIYKITNIITKKIYVGQRSTRKAIDSDSYLGSGTILIKSKKKYGIENFKKEILEICTNENLNEREIFWIKELGARNPEIGYNILIGGNGCGSGKDNPKTGIPLSPEHRKKISISNTGKVMSDASKENLRIKNKGKIITEEHRVRISQKHTGRVFSDVTLERMSLAKTGEKNMWFGTKGPMHGKISSKESNEKRSNTLSGRKRPQEVIDKILNTKRAKKNLTLNAL